MKLVDGYLELPDKPGLGVDLPPTAIGKDYMADGGLFGRGFGQALLVFQRKQLRIRRQCTHGGIAVKNFRYFQFKQTLQENR